jgi:hypothetical protein
VAGCCECGDEPPGSGAMELVTQASGFISLLHFYFMTSTDFLRDQFFQKIYKILYTSCKVEFIFDQDEHKLPELYYL